MTVPSSHTGREATLRSPMLPARDVNSPHRRSVVPMVRDLGYAPTTSIAEGIPRFVEWYRDYADA